MFACDACPSLLVYLRNGEAMLNVSLLLLKALRVAMHR